MYIDLYQFNKTKHEARKAGYYDMAPVQYNSYLKNGHIVEVAFCHLLGVMQRYMDYDFTIEVSQDLDNQGTDVLLSTPYGKKYIQIKHTYRLEDRERNKGDFLIAVCNSGSCIINNLFIYYRLPKPKLKRIDEDMLRAELNYIWLKYTRNMQDSYQGYVEWQAEVAMSKL